MKRHCLCSEELQALRGSQIITIQQEKCSKRAMGNGRAGKELLTACLWNPMKRRLYSPKCEPCYSDSKSYRPIIEILEKRKIEKIQLTYLLSQTGLSI